MNHQPQAITTAEARALLDGKSDKNRCMEMKSKPSSFYMINTRIFFTFSNKVNKDE